MVRKQYEYIVYQIKTIRNLDLDYQSWNLGNAEVSNGDSLALHFPHFGIYLIDEGTLIENEASTFSEVENKSTVIVIALQK
jgi:hypothetical protein